MHASEEATNKPCAIFSAVRGMKSERERARQIVGERVREAEKRKLRTDLAVPHLPCPESQSQRVRSPGGGWGERRAGERERGRERERKGEREREGQTDRQTDQGEGGREGVRGWGEERARQTNR